MNDISLVSVQHLSRHYGSLTAVDDVNFDLGQGEVLELGCSHLSGCSQAVLWSDSVEPCRRPNPLARPWREGTAAAWPHVSRREAGIQIWC